MNLSIGFSPCPNDTFIFYALIHGKIDTDGLRFHPQLLDVETLNRLAYQEKLDITKISFAAYLHLKEKYSLFTSGSALGNNCGPLLIAKYPLLPEAIRSCTVAIPGANTTANFLLDTFYAQIGEKTELNFARIEDAVLDEVTDAGVIIHENRFTYEKKGLLKIADLGEKWEAMTGFPIPLGGIAIKRSIPSDRAIAVNHMIRQSIEYAFAHQEETMEYVRMHAREMDEDVMRQHIQLYVNNYTIELGERGKAAIDCFFDHALNRKIVESVHQPIYIQ